MTSFDKVTYKIVFPM